MLDGDLVGRRIMRIPFGDLVALLELALVDQPQDGRAGKGLGDAGDAEQLGRLAVAAEAQAGDPLGPDITPLARHPDADHDARQIVVLHLRRDDLVELLDVGAREKVGSHCLG
jgi:hypothetical protein